MLRSLLRPIQHGGASQSPFVSGMAPFKGRWVVLDSMLQTHVAQRICTMIVLQAHASKPQASCRTFKLKDAEPGPR